MNFSFIRNKGNTLVYICQFSILSHLTQNLNEEVSNIYSHLSKPVMNVVQQSN